jgi:ketosteroid isomerase-like protein
VSANLDLVRPLYAAWERGDFTSGEWAHGEIEFVMADGPTPGSWKGLAGLAEGYREFLSAWEDFRVEADDFRELDDGSVLALVHYSGRGKTSRLELEQMKARAANLFQISGGKVTRVVIYLDRESALSDLGLASEADSPGS